ncbi:hypothetical protein FGG08_004953 [Glutinoglossum americanum]|uniref:Uncharacterized protein n=1 Tax=Glutinoglossum americanum TaxID=1670608 RepID=A0A9P8KWI2_9PEZI|nr:hypothetical protein FGG08_004953 [Glutinoglossum americanum]
MPSHRNRPSKFIDSPRHLVLRHGHRLIQRINKLDEGGPTLPPGYEKLHSFFVPGLEAGLHTIGVEQVITVPGDPSSPLKKQNFQKFNVVAPRFTLPDNTVYSVYPPQGHADRAEVLPHVVLTDPTLPWERIGSWEAERKKHPPEDIDYRKNRVPWLAVLSFTEEELRLAPSDLAGDTSLFKGTVNFKDKAQQSTTLSINMPVTDLRLVDTSRVATPVTYDPNVDANPDGSTPSTDAIFVPTKLFRSFFASHNANGVPEPASLDVSRYRFLAHLRNLNPTGMAEADTTDGDRAFSIVVGHRAGPLDITKPTTVVVHLVSIEGVERMDPNAVPQFVSLSSLYSWTYSCLPPNSLNVSDAFAGLGKTLKMLRPSLTDKQIASIEAEEPAGGRVARRMLDGYSITRYRAQTGEPTAAFIRGPFTPTEVPSPLTETWTALSTSGADLQILDQELGIMDLTYSAAWQLGKTLALADPAFTTALTSVRKQIFDLATSEAQAEALRKNGAHKSRVEILKSIGQSVKQLRDLPTSPQSQGVGIMSHRWRRMAVLPLDLSYHSDSVDPDIEKHLNEAAMIISSSVDDDGKPTEHPYDEHNTPYSTDWMVVLRWILDRAFLVNVPAHYFITDPIHLPMESLRFFHIDANWTEAFIDGGLSLANHLDREDDKIRLAIKNAYNRYIHTPNSQLGYAPPIPRYGFLLRSVLVTQFPDLVVKTFPELNSTSPPVILRHENIDKGVMLCLFAEAPSANTFESLTLAQPPHQQFFTIADELTVKYIEMTYKKIYTVKEPNDPKRREGLERPKWKRGEVTPRKPVFLWGDNEDAPEIRTLLFDNFANDLFNSLVDGMNTKEHWFDEKCATAAMVGIQLNDPNWQLTIDLKDPAAVADLSIPATGPKPRALTIKKRKVRPKMPIKTLQQVETRSAPHPTFQERTRVHPLILAHPPPHFRIPASRSVVEIQRGSDDPAGAPKYIYSAYPSDQLQSPTIPMAKIQDLVFSIVYKEGAQDFKIVKVTLAIRLGNPAGPGDVRGPMMSTYAGSGATMLSNLRLNVIPLFETRSDRSNWLVLTLMPRSTRGWIEAELVKEMSFLLSGVSVNVSPDAVKSTVIIREYYQFGQVFEYSFEVNLAPLPS